MKSNTGTNPYINFSKVMSKKLRDENSKLKFGQISKKVAALWKKMTQEEKDAYKVAPKEEEQTNQ